MELGSELRDEKPEAADVEARRWREEIAARLFDTAPAEIRIGRYVVRERVGEGASGVVYAAHDPELDRRVAIKLLRADASLPGPRADAWLAREAKTLARLSHPNVLPVYDVGTHEDQVFMAVELVTGTTLQQWLDEPRPLEEVLDVFAQAARGLAAAHEAGLVHRDFKPANVLIGIDGRVRVSDFGVASHLDREDTEATGVDLATSASSGVFDARETKHRAGTPAYMAPEQFLGDPIDGRTDQFGFCVALHEAVYGERPFRGRSGESLAANVIAGRRRVETERESPPPWLESLIARGLSVDPDDRYPKMDALLAELERTRGGGRGRGRIAVASLLGAVAAVAVTAVALHDEAPEPCSDGADKLAGVWTPERDAAVAQAFRATGVAYAEDSLARVDEAIQHYGDRWVDTYVQACDGATEVAVVRRMHCLQSRLLELESLGEVLAQADAAVVEHAVASVSAMIGPDECLYVGDGTPSPDDEDRTDAAHQVRWAVARAKAKGNAGHPQEALELARDAVEQAQDLGDRSLEAEALLVRGAIERALIGVVTDDEAESSIYKALLAAEAAHRPDLTARALVAYLGIAESLGRLGRLSQWEARARRAVEAVGSPPALVGKIEYTMALVHEIEGDLASSRVAAERALTAFEAAGPANRRHLASAYNLMGEIVFTEGNYDEALPLYERYFDLVLDALGPNHAWTANAYGNTAEVYFKHGRYEEALEYFQVALEIRKGVYGDDSVWVVHSLGHVGDLQLQLGRLDEAVTTYERALEGHQVLRLRMRERPDTAQDMLSVYRDLQAWDQEQWFHQGMALVYLDAGDPERALEHATKIPEPVMPKDRHHPDQIGRIDVHGRALMAAGRWKEAVAALESAVARMKDWYPPGHPGPSWGLEALGIAQLESGDPERARGSLQEALRLRRTWATAHPRAMGDTRFALARALTALDEPMAEAIELARSAHDDYKRAANVRTGDAARVEAWLAEHEPASTP